MNRRPPPCLPRIRHPPNWPVSAAAGCIRGPLATSGSYHLTTLKNAPSRPVVAELVGPGPRPLTGARVATALLATAPLAARLGWWWWSQGRHRTLTASAPFEPAPAAVEHTEIEMVKRTLGRWRLRVSSTRWVVPVGSAVSTAPARKPRANWLGPVLRLTGAALEANSRKAPPEVPRLRAAPGQPRRRLPPANRR